MTESDTPTTTEQHDRIDALEAENEQLREQLAALRETVEDIEASVESDSADQGGPVTTADDEPSGPTAVGGLSRRGALAGLAGLGVLGIGAGSQPVAADDDHDHVGQMWSGDVANILHLVNTATSGKYEALRAEANSPTGEAIRAINHVENTDDGSETAIGVYGISKAPHGNALFGHATHESGPNFGGRGETQSTDGTGLYGVARAEEGGTRGVRGAALSPDGRGVVGQNFANSGEAVGLFGMTQSPDGYGLHTPDDAKIEGTVETDDEWRVETESDDDAGNVVQGHPDNEVGGQVVGSTIAGGGSADAINSVYGDYSFAAGRGADASHDGAIVFGDSTDSEIKSNNANEALFQTDLATEGDFSFSDGSSQRTAGPIAKGRIDETGSIIDAVNVKEVTWNSTDDRYEITIPDLDDSSYNETAVVTPVNDPLRACTRTTDSDDLVVEFQGGQQCDFFFALYDL